MVLYCLDSEVFLEPGPALQRLAPWYPHSICSLGWTLRKTAEEAAGSRDQRIRGKTPQPLSWSHQYSFDLAFWEVGERMK